MLNLFLAATLALQPAAPQLAATAEIPPSPEQVLAIPAELRGLLQKQVIDTTHSRKERLDRLVDFIFADTGLNMRYENDTTHNVEQAFLTRKANCLSLTLLAIALAREAGLEAYGQEMDRVLAWDMTDDVVTQSTHANAGIVVGGNQYVIDVAFDSLIAVTLPHRIDDAQLLSLYYNNRAMELMLQRRFAEASTWMQAALRENDGHPMLWNNAGVLSLRMGDAKTAESNFQKALVLDPKHPTALVNMAGYYRRIGDISRADEWQKRADRAIRRDPFQQFMLGQRSEGKGDYATAADHYRRAIRLDRNQPLFHFGLARAWLRTGETRRAGYELKLAHDLSDGEKRDRYQAKLDALQRLQQLQ